MQSGPQARRKNSIPVTQTSRRRDPPVLPFKNSSCKHCRRAYPPTAMTPNRQVQSPRWRATRTSMPLSHPHARQSCVCTLTQSHASGCRWQILPKIGWYLCFSLSTNNKGWARKWAKAGAFQTERDQQDQAFSQKIHGLISIGAAIMAAGPQECGFHQLPNADLLPAKSLTGLIQVSHQLSP